ncbi:hypothetical protein [Erwinia sp. MYb416]|uniref:hypothetical protein n=1 Tax=Erwinia sp. MYb416 TaxID=3108532 RepID=UPI0030B27AE6
MENEYWEYLAVGGELHGKIYEALARRSHIDLPIEDRRLPGFSESTVAAKVTERPTVMHKVHIEHK